ncbi:DUF6230 family protein [Streptomyces sp. TLI_146]|uniref:DUF6230 family protein n=1 Tax=Streptomyces sp. TLI_146 TaxID=1938858 RepID=UPI000C70D155|nr:DUF6230 family protein [Streptomyces sp. TLI_146]PKV87962.1 hypothetical protein BX283_5568 [Streptomyces sp. TLI_146]
MESQVRGGTRWKRFALVMVPSVAATAAIGIGLAQGALAASFSVSGVDFKVTADQLVGHNMLQYGSIDSGAGKNHPVVVSGFNHAEITNMCQSVVTPLPFDIPGIGKAVTMKIEAGTEAGKPVVADNIYLDVSELDTDATFKNIDIGVAAGEGQGTGDERVEIQPGKKGTPGESPSQYGFAQRAKEVVLDGVQQRAWATTAASFKLNGLKLRLSGGSNECQLKPKAH